MVKDIVVFDNYLNLEIDYISPHVYIFWLVVDELKKVGKYRVRPLMVKELEQEAFLGNVKSDVFVLTYAGARMPWKVCDMFWKNTGKIVGICNEYTIILSMMGKLSEYDVVVDLIVNVDKTLLNEKDFKGKEKIRRYEVVNLNVLKYRGDLTGKLGSSFVKRPLIYWGGSLRTDRVVYFRKYLNDSRVCFSVSKRQVKRYKELGIDKCVFVDTVDWGYSRRSGVYLVDYEATVYIEDRLTHKVWNFPANRFYEALEYGLAVFFAEECMNTVNRMREMGYFIDDWWIVSSVDQIFDKLKSKDFKERKVEFLEVNRKVALCEKGKVMEEFRNLLFDVIEN